MLNFFKSLTNSANSGGVVVRMAPSPTGNLHIGTARTTLFNFLFAKSMGGKFILRIEDTDKERSSKEFEKDILDGLEWLGLNHDELYRQSERTDIYVSYLKKMIENGSAYVSKEEPKEEGQRSEVIRFKNPNKKIIFNDVIRGQIEFDTTELEDFVIARSETEPLYHLAVVVDDHEMSVTHIIRGEDHISNTPRQILIQEAIGAQRPIYAHIPLILDSDRKKLSKRKHGEAVWVDTYKNKGYLSEALLNYLALIGWNPGTEQEIFTLKELIKAFKLSQVQKGGAIFDEKKLDWVNKEHIKLLSPEEQLEIKKREVENEPYMNSEPNLDINKINWKTVSSEETITHLQKVIEIISKNGGKEEIMAYTDEIGKASPSQSGGRGNVLWPTRYALTGEEKSPDPFTLMTILGKDKSIARLEKAITLLKQ
ncbi:glutamate--tRNA ligase [Candidatus Parcubacteria bacterium]|nr:glutamate--tRNA ligase [Candidatus Parcubacteria bacterium]